MGMYEPQSPGLGGFYSPGISERVDWVMEKQQTKRHSQQASCWKRGKSLAGREKQNHHQIQEHPEIFHLFWRMFKVSLA